MSRREYPDRPICGVGAVVIKEGKVLLVKRGVDPNKGLWAIPGGSLKLGETLQEGAEREILEETGVTIRAGAPVYSFDFFEEDSEGRIRFHYVIIDLVAEFRGGKLRPSDDASEAGWFTPEQLQKLKITESTRAFLRKIEFIPKSV